MAAHMEVVHNWARQGTRDKRGFNMYSHGNIIFSYGEHFPIARIIPGSGYVLMTSRDYSVSTSKHKTYTWRGIHANDLTAFVVDDVMANSNVEHMHNVKDYEARIEEAKRKHKRARTYKDMWETTINKLTTEMQDYKRIFLPDFKF